MARKTMTVYACAACLRKTGESVQAVTTLEIGDHVWDLCREHGDRFTAMLSDALDGDESEPEPEGDEAGPAVAIVGTIKGYTAEEARAAVESLGYNITGHVDETTAFIIIGERAERSHKVVEAMAHETPVIDAREPGVFAGMIKAGELTAHGQLPEPKPRITGKGK